MDINNSNPSESGKKSWSNQKEVMMSLQSFKQKPVVKRHSLPTPTHILNALANRRFSHLNADIVNSSVIQNLQQPDISKTTYSVEVKITNENKANSKSKMNIKFEMSTYGQSLKSNDCSWLVLENKEFFLNSHEAHPFQQSYQLKNYEETESDKIKTKFKLIIEKIKRKNVIKIKVNEVISFVELKNNDDRTRSFYFLQKNAFSPNKSVRVDIFLISEFNQQF